jgi:PAS domain S-box-containing protein
VPPTSSSHNQANSSLLRTLALVLAVFALLALLVYLFLTLGSSIALAFAAVATLAGAAAAAAFSRDYRVRLLPKAAGFAQDRAVERLTELLDSAMDAIITVDENQNIVLYNREAEKIFGWPAGEILGKSLNQLIPERFHAAHGGHIKRFGQTGVASRRMGGAALVYARRADGLEFPVDASISQLDSVDGKLFTVILRDASERLRGLEEHARLSALLDSAMDAIVSVDEAQKIVLYNRAAEKIFGWPAAAVLGQALEKLLPPRYRKSHAADVHTFSATGTTSRSMGDGTVLYGQRASGEEFPVEASISQLLTPQGKLFTVILRDVSERVRAQEELSVFAAQAHSIREAEKSRVARELHDDLAQSLTALKMDTIWVRSNLADGNLQVKGKLADMLSMLDATVAATRRIAADLRPLLLDDLGLVPALEWLVNNFTQRHGVACTLCVDQEVDLPEPYATAIFRIVQESLVNVAKHAQASRVEVSVVRTPDKITLRVRDDGCGFLPQAPRKVNSLGLMGLRERARLLKGSISINSQPGQGTQIEVSIPVPQPGGVN